MPNKERALEKLKELEKDENFNEKLKSLSTLSEVVKAFNDEGVEVTEEDMQQIFKDAVSEGEVSEEELANVAGGCKGWFYKISIFYWIGRYIGTKIKCG